MSGLASLIKDMRKHGQDIDEFDFVYNRINFVCIIDISNAPFQMLLGAKLHNWACVINIEPGYMVEMMYDDFGKLCNILKLKAGKGSFTSFMFFKYINTHAPLTCSLKPVQPSHIMPFRKNKIAKADEPDKDVFLDGMTILRMEERLKTFQRLNCS